MSGETTDSTWATIPDSGADTNTPLTLHREEIRTLAYMEAEKRDAIVGPLFGWLAFGEWNPPLDMRARSVFDGLVRKHGEAVAKHRENSAKQQAKAVKRWRKTSPKNAVAMPPQCRGYAYHYHYQYHYQYHYPYHHHNQKNRIRTRYRYRKGGTGGYRLGIEVGVGFDFARGDCEDGDGDRAVEN